MKEHVQTTFQEPWTIVPTSDTAGGAASSLVIHTDSTLHTVDGFGSCFNEQGWASLSFENRASQWGWHQNSLVTVNDSAKTYKYTPEYYVMKHASHYVMPGARMLALGGNYDDAIAFLNPDHSVIVMVGNQDDDAKTLTVSINGHEQNIPVASYSVNTYVFK